MTGELRDIDGEQATTFAVLPNDRGTYLVTTTSGTIYTFDLAQRTVTRTPCPSSPPGIHDGVRRLRSIDACAVGATGYWTMLAGDPLIDYFWQTTTVIVSIVAAPPPVTGPGDQDHRPKDIR